MNASTPVLFPPRSPLSLRRQVRENDTHSPLQADFEALRACEENLRQYEARLRAFQAELEAAGAIISRTGQTGEPFSAPIVPRNLNDGSTPAAWDKLYRARALLEAEQAQARDDRLFLKESQKQLEAREKALAAREARMDEWERQAVVMEEEPERSGVARFIFGARK